MVYRAVDKIVKMFSSSHSVCNGEELLTRSRLRSSAPGYKHSEGGNRVEERWRDFFSDPSQWLDHTAHKANPKYPDFKHKTTGVGLWIESKWNPVWVKTELSYLTPGSVCRGLYSWNIMIFECVKCNQELEALHLYNQMQEEGVTPDSFTFVRVLNACASLMALEEGRRVHTQIIQRCCDNDVFIGNTLVDMYAKCGSIEDAEIVFFRMPITNVVSWNAMFAGYVRCGESQKAIELFTLMQDNGVKPNPVTFLVVLNACASIMALEAGRRVHEQVIENGFESEMLVGNTLVDMYAKCGSVEDAQIVFHKMPFRDVVSWTALLTGYVKSEQGRAEGVGNF